MDGTDRDKIAAGMRAGLPVALGYLPAAFAFGAAASAIGLSAPEVGAMSAIVFSGANQAFLLAAIPAGMPVVLMVALTAAASLRHLLYGLVLRDRIGGTRPQRAAFAYGLTDEVFATALAASTGDHGRYRPAGRWLIGLALTAWAAWSLGSVAGAAAGDALRRASESAASAMGFALPALFIGLMLGALRREVAVPVALAAAIAALAVLSGHAQLAIPGGALACLQRKVVPLSASLWTAFIVIGALTYLTRALPLLSRRRGNGASPPAWLDALGPCILAAIAVAVLLPEARAALAAGAWRPFALGSVAAAAIMLWRRDAGLATLAGVAAYWLAIWSPRPARPLPAGPRGTIPPSAKGGLP